MAPSKTLPADQYCNLCKNKQPSKDDLFVKCTGLCGHTFHINCVNVGKREYNALNANSKNMKWMCDHCEVVLCDSDGSLISSTITWNTKDAPLLNKILSKIDSLATIIYEMKTEIIELRAPQNVLAKTSANVAKIGHVTTQKIAVPTKKTIRSQSVNDSFLTRTCVDLQPNDNQSAGLVTSPLPTSNAPDTYAAKVTAMYSEKVKQGAIPKNMTTINEDSSKRKYVKPIVGTNMKPDNNVKLSAVPRKTYLHVWNAAPETDEDLIKQYMVEKSTDTNIVCEKLTAKGNYASFKVCIDQSSFDTWMDPNMWPTGIRVNRFFHRRLTPTSPKVFLPSPLPTEMT